jgi:DNA primase
VTIEEKEDPQAGLRKRLYAIHAELAAFYHRCLKEAKEAQRAREYLKSRSLDGDVAESFQLGYAPVSSAAMLKWASKYKFKPEDLAAAGVLLPPRYEGGNWYNRFAGRLVFPIRDKMGRTLAFSCRTLETDKAKMRGGKYVNSSDSIIFKKSDKKDKTGNDAENAIVPEEVEPEDSDSELQGGDEMTDTGEADTDTETDNN